MRTERVDIAIVGGGLAGLSAAVAAHRVLPHAKIKVYERRAAPPNYTRAAESDNSNTSKQDVEPTTAAEAEAPNDSDLQAPLGGGVRIEMNGVKALAAISRSLAGSVVSKGLYANKVLLHDTQGGAVITRLHEPPHPSAPSPRQPALMVGWSELESLLLDRLPPGTVEWETVATGYTDSPSGATLDLLLPSHTDDAPVASHALSTAMTHALDVELHQHMDQQHAQLQLEQQQQQAAAAAAAAVPSSPFSAPSSNPAFAGTGPAPAAAPVAAAGLLTAPRLERVSVKARLLIAADGPMSLLRQQCVGDGEPDFEGMVRWVGRLPGDMLSTIPVEQEAWWMGPGMTFASHPLSGGDVAWEAQVSSSCLEKAGLRWDQQTQSIVRDDSSSSSNNKKDAAGIDSSGNNIASTAAAAPAGPSGNNSYISSNPHVSNTESLLALSAAAAAAAASHHTDAASSGSASGGGSSDTSGGGGSSSAKRHSNRAAVPADAPAGEDHGDLTTGSPSSAVASPVATLAAAAALAQAVATSAPSTPHAAAATAQGANGLTSAGNDSGPNTSSSGASAGNNVRHVKISFSQPETIGYSTTAQDGTSSSAVDASPREVKALLTRLFAGFPTACLDMIETTDAAAILEGPVLTRAARAMPACMGRGSVVVLGEAAHPVRPSGQEAAQACEDAAEFGAALMESGICREALRRFELRRRARWTHAMQVSRAFGSVTNLGGVALHQGLLDYTAQLYHVRFVPLRTIHRVTNSSTSSKPQKPSKARNPLLHWTGVALLTYGILAAAGLTHRHLAKHGKSPLGGRLNNDPLAQAVVGAVDAVGQSAVKVVSSAADAVQAPGQTAAAIKSAAAKGVSAAADAVQSPGQTAAAVKSVAAKGVNTAAQGVSAAAQGSSQAVSVIGRQVGKVASRGVGGEEGDNGPGSSSDVVVHGEAPPRHRKGLLRRARDGIIKRTLGVGAVLSKPFTHVLGHQVKSTVAESLGAF